MPIRTLAVAVLLGLALSPTLGRAQSAPVLTSVTVDLPAGDRMFPGDGADAINNNCLACHSAGMVLNQPNFPKAVWEATVHKMIDVYKAPIEAGDAAAIVDYLARTQGAD